MFETQINLSALRRLFSEPEWAKLTNIGAFNEVANNLQSTEDIEKVVKLGLDLLENR